MGRNGGFGSLRGFDAFSKTIDDVRVRTNIGAYLTLLSFSLIFTLTLLEFVDYRTLHLRQSLEVDRSRGERLTVNLNVTFPRVPCYLISLDIMDISGEHQNDLTHDIIRSRLTPSGALVPGSGKANLKGEADRLAALRAKNYCGDCYGGTPPESGCCNSCDEVREAYARRGWSFSDPDHIDQCISEHWSEHIKEQNGEGCNVAGKIHVNKVVGNFHLSPGKAFQQNSIHAHDLVPYLSGTGANHHDFGHIIHEFGFGSAEEFADVAPGKKSRGKSVKERLGAVDPLKGVKAHTEESQFMFQYFLKVVPTEYRVLNGEILKTHQYSVTSYERDLSDHPQGGGVKKADKDPHAQQQHQVTHGFSGIPGVFFNYEIGALKAVTTETRQSLSHFLTSTCAIVGGILTVAGLLDGLIYNGRRRLAGKGGDEGVDGLGYAAAGGKFL